MTQDIRPQNAADALKELYARLYKVEQKASAPGSGSGSGGMGSDPSVNTITIGGVVVGAPASPATNLVLTLGTYLENIFVDADWDAPVDGTAESYDVEYAKKTGSTYELVGNIRTGGTSVRIQRLEPQTTYGVRVTAINRIGVRSVPLPSSGFTDVTTGIDATIPAQVTGVQVTAGIRSVTVTWLEVADKDVARGTGTYEVQLSLGNTFVAGFTWDLFTAGTVYSFTGLTTGTTYYARVRAIDNSGNAGPWSSIVSTSTGQVGSVDIADTAVITSKLAAGAVDNSKLAALAVDAAKLADSAVTSTKIANLAVGSAAIQALAVGTAHIADASILTAKIGDLAVTTAKISDLSVTNGKIANLAVDDAKIASLDAGKITAGTISANRIAANSLDVNKLSTSTLNSATITIGAGGSFKIGNPPTTGIFINDQGIRLYNSGAVKMALDVAGTASFEGNISASTITSSTLTSATINSGTITGTTVRTASSGKRIALEAGVIDTLKLYSGSVNESVPGWLAVADNSGSLVIQITAPKTSLNNYGIITADAVTGGNGASANLMISSGGAGGGADAIRAYLSVDTASNAAVPTVLGVGVDMALFQFGDGANAEARLAGSGNYCFLYLNGGGTTATLNCNVGLGAGFHVLNGGNALFNPIQASAFNVSSARAVKSNIRDEGVALDRIMAMRVKRYKRDLGDPMAGGYSIEPIGKPGIQRKRVPTPAHIQRTIDLDEIGLMADELIDTVPEAVVTNADGVPHGINIGVLVALLVKSVQELAVLKADK